MWCDDCGRDVLCEEDWYGYWCGDYCEDCEWDHSEDGCDLCEC